jgi:hypothetical protein
MTEPTSPARPEPPGPWSPATAEPTASAAAPGTSPTAPAVATTFPGGIPTQPPAGYTYPGYPYPGHPVAAAQPYWPVVEGATAARKKGHGGLFVTLVLVAIMVLCGGVATTAYVVTTHQSGTGQSNPTVAVDRFLTAVYVHQSATEAEKYVCEQANDSTAIAAKVDQARALSSRYDDPTFSWTFGTVTNQSSTEATVTAELAVTTADERRAAQKISFTTVQNHGWWVCDVNAGSN